MTNKNPWRKFSDELPIESVKILIKDDDDTYEFNKGVEGGFPNYASSLSELGGIYKGSCLDELEWHYDQDGWLFPEEVTGNEDADYWLVTMKDGEQYSVSFKEKIDFESFLEAIINDGLLLVVKPMKHQQPPEWMK